MPPSGSLGGKPVGMPVRSPVDPPARFSPLGYQDRGRGYSCGRDWFSKQKGLFGAYMYYESRYWATSAYHVWNYEQVPEWSTLRPPSGRRRLPDSSAAPPLPPPPPPQSPPPPPPPPSRPARGPWFPSPAYPAETAESGPWTVSGRSVAESASGGGSSSGKASAGTSRGGARNVHHQVWGLLKESGAVY